MKGHGGPLHAKKLVSHAWKSSFMNAVLSILLDASSFTAEEPVACRILAHYVCVFLINLQSRNGLVQN
jgi:hypothetical protein